MSKSGETQERFPIQYFDGVNATVQSNLAKRTELRHVENARSPEIGILEKREGQVNKGTAVGGGAFAVTKNSGLFFFDNESGNQSVYRVSTVSGDTNIYQLNAGGEWEIMSDSLAQGLSDSSVDTTNVDGNIVIVNGVDQNRYIKKDGTSVVSATEAGNLYNSPRARKVVFYKNRIHLADFIQDSERYPNTIIRSSYPLGVIALADGDHPAGSEELRVTDSKYFYSDAGVNTYDVYRGGQFIETVTVTGVNELSVEIEATANSILSSDEIWIGGSYTGAKQHRWVNNASITGRDVKQYDTFKLTGGDNSPITMMETVGNIMMIGNKNNLMTWDENNLVNMDLGIGAASTRGNVKLLGTLYFIDYNGIYGTTGGMPTLLSRKVERYIKGATKAGIENSVAGRKGLSVFFTLGDVTLYKADGSIEKTLKKVALEYSTADQNWYVHTNVDFDNFISFTDVAGKEQLWGTLAEDKAVSSFLEGNTDNGREIFFRADTQEIQLMQEFEAYASPLGIGTETERGSQLQCFISYDQKDFFELSGTVSKGVSRLKIHRPKKDGVSPAHCMRIVVSYRDSSKQRCRIKQLAIDYLPTSNEVSYE